MNEQIRWEIVQEKQSSYFSEAYDYLKKASKEEIELRFSTVDSSCVLLSLFGSLLYSDIKNEVSDYFERIVYYAIDGNPTQIIWARKIIVSIDRDFLEKNLPDAILNNIYSKNENNDQYYLYLNIVSLLNFLQLKDFLNTFLVTFCMRSSNPDILEIYEDYSYGKQPNKRRELENEG